MGSNSVSISIRGITIGYIQGNLKCSVFALLFCRVIFTVKLKLWHFFGRLNGDDDDKITQFNVHNLMLLIVDGSS